MIATASSIIRNAPGPFDAEVWLDYEGRSLRRKRLACPGGDFLVDLPEVTCLSDGDAFELSDGRVVAIRAAPEPVLVIRGHLARLAWHIGNRHTPCRIEADRLVIREDDVLEAMLRKLGAEICRKDLPFRPEAGAFGHGRSFGQGPVHVRGHGNGSCHSHDHLGTDHTAYRDKTHGQAHPPAPPFGDGLFHSRA
ncbi:MAG: urease accessory protein UreE [Paracoccus sp. (in: a-proteobacteria)]|nr:urease accessory protein UreE [Paracoccus sp. (in: a-proteobacteria)]